MIGKYVIAVALVVAPPTLAGDLISIPIRWCGVEGAASMVNPGVVNEATTDNVLWRRHERPSDQMDSTRMDMTFRSADTPEEKNGTTSFPIIRDVSGTDGNLLDDDNYDAIVMCRRAWLVGDPLYFDANGNNFVNSGTDTLLSTDAPVAGQVDLGHNGASLNAAPGDVLYVDSNDSGVFDIGEPIYRDEDMNGVVGAGDTLLINDMGVTEGQGDMADIGETLFPLPSAVRYVDLIREPINTFNIGYPTVQGLTAVNAGDMDYSGIAFPVHGVNNATHGVVLDDASQYLPPGDDFTLFEVQLVAHEFGHALSLPHGNGNDDNGNGVADDAGEDDGVAPVPGAGPDTLCSTNNVMSYCWLDNGTAGMPDMEFIGVGGTPTSGTFTTLQRAQLRTEALNNIPDRVVDPIHPPLVTMRVDAIGEVKDDLAHLDIAEVEIRVGSDRAQTTLSIFTRRPFPEDFEGPSAFFFRIDEDRNPASGASVEALKEAGVPGEFQGAERVGIVRLRGRQIADVSVLELDANGGLTRVELGRIRAVIERLDMIPDFPMGRGIDPDRPPRPVTTVPSQEVVRLIFPFERFRLSDSSALRAEFMTTDGRGSIIDRASARYLDFALPVFPECDVVPASIQRGRATNVLATGLLPNQPIHLLLGADEVAQGRADGDGKAQLELPIPADATLGKRLVTVGALAVTADCTVTVEADGPADGGFPGIPTDNGGLDGARFVMTAQFLCGPADREIPSGMTDGTYETLVTLVNSSAKPTRFAKLASRALPRQQAGPVSDAIIGEIPAFGSISVECDEIRNKLGNTMNAEFRGGALLFYATNPIAGTAVYSVKSASGGTVSLHTEPLLARRIQ